jgi:hypothetical protein
MNHNISEANERYIQLFEAFSKVEQGVAELFLHNQNLLKLLKYTDNDPLNMPPLDEDTAADMMIDYYRRKGDKGIVQWEINKDCRIYFIPFINEKEELQRSQIRVYPVQINPQNIYIGELYIQVDVIVPVQLEKIVNGRRKNSIVTEVIKSLNGKEIGMINPLMIEDKPLKLNHFLDNYWGYSLLFKTGVAARGQ